MYGSRIIAKHFGGVSIGSFPGRTALTAETIKSFNRAIAKMRTERKKKKRRKIPRDEEGKKKSKNIDLMKYQSDSPKK
jgi:hypothetical protein